MNYCVDCLSYDYCSARGMCIDPPFGYCTRYQPKSWCVVKGHWIEEKSIGDCYYKCSECGFILNAYRLLEMEDYCPQCGAKMDEISKDNETSSSVYESIKQGLEDAINGDIRRIEINNG